MTGLRTPKKAYLRNAEYYDFQNVLDNLYALSKKEMIFTDLMKYISSEQNIRLAYRNIKGNTGSRTAGADNKTISHLAKWEISALIQHIQKKLNYYQPKKSAGWKYQKEMERQDLLEYQPLWTGSFNNVSYRY